MCHFINALYINTLTIKLINMPHIFCTLLCLQAFLKANFKPWLMVPDGLFIALITGSLWQNEGYRPLFAAAGISNMAFHCFDIINIARFGKTRDTGPCLPPQGGLCFALILLLLS
eukprot:SAG31_NODE_726_length_12541_cov_4.922922_7_plen_115_part_00